MFDGLFFYYSYFHINISLDTMRGEDCCKCGVISCYLEQHENQTETQGQINDRKTWTITVTVYLTQMQYPYTSISLNKIQSNGFQNCYIWIFIQFPYY